MAVINSTLNPIKNNFVLYILNHTAIPDVISNAPNEPIMGQGL
jgi:hypothetical protein